MSADEPDAAEVADSSRTMFDDDHASKALGIEMLSASNGRAVARMRVDADMVNGHAIAHGGYVFLLADTAFACACNSYGPVTVAAGAEITFVAPVHDGDELYAYAEERTRYGRSGIYDVTVRRGSGDQAAVVAEFRGRSRSIRGKGAAT